MRIGEDEAAIEDQGCAVGPASELGRVGEPERVWGGHVEESESELGFVDSEETQWEIAIWVGEERLEGLDWRVGSGFEVSEKLCLGGGSRRWPCGWVE